MNKVLVSKTTQINGLMDCYPTYHMDSDLGNRPPMLTQPRQVRFTRKARRKQTEY